MLGVARRSAWPSTWSLVFLVVRGRCSSAPIGAHLARQRRAAADLRRSAILLIVLFVSARDHLNLGVFAIIGGFVVGVALHDDRRFVAEWKRGSRRSVNMFFLPIFFAYTGLRTDIGTHRQRRTSGALRAGLAVAFVGKFGGAYCGARLVGEATARRSPSAPA